MDNPGRVLTALSDNRRLGRVTAAYGLFILNEYSVWIAMLVYAFAHGGAKTVGFVVLLQTIPASIVAPLAATVADRRSPATLLTVGYVAQTAAIGVTGVLLLTATPSYAVYAGAMLTSSAVALTRPAQTVLLPGLVGRPEQLTAIQLLDGWVESGSIVAAGAMTGALVAVGGAGLVFAVCTVLGGVAVALVATTRTRVTAREAGVGKRLGHAFRDVADGVRLLAHDRYSRLLVFVLTLSWVFLGALDVLLVVIAVSVLHQGPAWVGYLNMAFGIGGVLAGPITASLVGRRLGPPIVIAGLVMSLGLACTSTSANVVANMVFLALAGMGTAVLQVASRTLLQRTVPTRLLGRVFGVLEAASMIGLAIGAVLTPLLIRWAGDSRAIVGVAGLVPFAVLMCARSLVAADAAAHVPTVEIALLRTLDAFAPLPPPTLEELAGSLQLVRLPPHSVVLRQGELGDCFYAIAEGEVEVTIHGRFLARRGRGEGVGEIALLRNVPRTATVTTVGSVTMYRLDAAVFLAAVTGHLGARTAVARVVDAHLASDP